MRIVQIIPSLNIAGAERMCETLSCELQRMGHEVIVVSLYSTNTSISDSLEKKGIRVVRLGKKSGLDLSMIPKLRRFLRKERPDVIHAHLIILKYVCVATMFQKVKTVHTVHTIAQNEGGKLDKIASGFFYKIKKATPVALNDEVRKSIVDVYGLPNEQVPVVFNGSDLTKCICKKDYSFGEKINILHVGRFDPVKNHLGLMEAFGRFVRTYPNGILHLVGDGECRCEIEKYIDEHRLGENVVLHGLQSNVHKYMHEADIFILPSKYEGFPVTIIEAMGTGLPIIATDVGGIPNVICNGETGTLTSLETNDIVRAMMNYAENEELRKTHGQNARDASAAFSSVQMAHGYEEIYKRLI